MGEHYPWCQDSSTIVLNAMYCDEQGDKWNMWICEYCRAVIEVISTKETADKWNMQMGITDD